MPDDGLPGVPVGGAAGAERLPCGASVDALLAQVADDRAPRDPEHQRRCPHCRAALAELRDVWSPVEDLAAEEVRAPAGLLDSIMARVRELSRNPWHAFLPGPRGHTRIAARVVGVIARLAAESVPRVTLALGQGHTGSAASAADIAGPAGEVASDVGVAGAHVVVDVQVVVDHGARIPEVARQVREQISRDLREHAGLMTAEVNVIVIDVRT